MGEVLPRDTEKFLISDEDPDGTTLRPISDWSTYKQLQEPEEQLRLDSSETPPESKLVPGVSTERRFHRHHPDILVPNVLLRRHLREQFSQDGLYSAEYGLAGTSQIAKGYAQGEQSRLHKALVVTSQFAPRRLYFALLGQLPITINSGNDKYGAKIYSINSGSLSYHDFVGSIVSVRACSGEASSIFLVRTDSNVHVINLYFKGGKRDAILELQSLLQLDHQLLGGARPSAAFCSSSGTSKICVLTDDGILRVWNTSTTVRGRPRSDDFRLSHTIRLPKQSHSARDVVFISAKFPDDILLLYEDRILSANLVSKTIKLVYEIQGHVRIAKLAMLSTKSEACLGCILTTDRVLLGDFSHGWRLLADWKHYYDVAKSPDLHLFSASSSVSVVLHFPALGLCALYVAHVVGGSTSAQQVQRLPLEMNDNPACIHPYHILTNQRAPRQPLLGIIYMSCHSSMMHTLYGGALTSVTSTRSHRLLGPAVINASLLTPFAITQSAEEDTSHLDLHSWYRDLVSRTDHIHTRTSRETFSNIAVLGHESFDLANSNFATFDNDLEKLVMHEHEKNVTSNDVYGLRLYEKDADAMDPECNTAHNIFRLFRAWSGARTLLNMENLAQEKRTQIVHEKAAMSIAPATIVLKVQNDEPPQLGDLTRLKQKTDRAQGSQALYRLFDDWQISQAPGSYSWQPLHNRQIPLDLKSLTIQEIPAFRNIPPIVASSQMNSTTNLQDKMQDDPRSSQETSQFAATQPVHGKFGDRKVKRKKKAGF